MFGVFCSIDNSWGSGSEVPTDSSHPLCPWWQSRIWGFLISNFSKPVAYSFTNIPSFCSRILSPSLSARSGQHYLVNGTWRVHAKSASLFSSQKCAFCRFLANVCLALLSHLNNLAARRHRRFALVVKCCQYSNIYRYAYSVCNTYMIYIYILCTYTCACVCKYNI